LLNLLLGRHSYGETEIFGKIRPFLTNAWQPLYTLLSFH
jgi:hypothetical protein